MVEGVNTNFSALERLNIESEFEDVIKELKIAFPGKSEVELEQAVNSYLEANKDKTTSQINTQEMLTHITKTLNVAISTEAATAIKKEWEDLTQSMDVGVDDLAQVLDGYSSRGMGEATREYMVMLWQMLQGELEEAFGEEVAAVADANKQIQKKEFEEFVQKKAEEMEKMGKGKFWNKLLKWGGVVASLLGAAVACVVAAVAIATGVGAVAGALLIAGAAIMVGMAVAGTVSAVLSECGVEWSLGSGLGKGIAKLINALGGDVDEDKFATYFALAVQIVLTVAAIACTLGAGLVAAPGAVGAAGANAASTAASTGASAASTGASAASTGASAASSAASAGASAASAGTTIVTTAATTSKLALGLAKIANALKLLSAALGLTMGAIQVGQAVNTYQLGIGQAALLELQALLEKLSTARNMDLELAAAILSIIFEAMRGDMADGLDTLVKDMENAAGMNLNKA